MIDLKGKIGKYRIVKKLGSGGFGTVYLAEDTILKALRALKIPHKTTSKSEKLLQESILQTRLLDHPNIVKLLTVDIIEENLVMVMEYIEGTNLEKEIDSQGKLEINTALNYFKQILSALEFAHQHKVIHRDIRPSNILLNQKKEVKVTDFGTSTLLHDKEYATTRIGSPPYMAPEQFEGKTVFASDLYSAGCLFYEMVSGFPPIVMANPVEIYKKAKAGEITPLAKKNNAVSQELSWLIARILMPDINQRYASAGQVLRDLYRLEKKSLDITSEVQDIQRRIQARETRTDYICWNCRKAMGRRMSTCPYCGKKQ